MKGNLNIPPGTTIATFDPGGSYGSRHDGTSHAAIYLGQTSAGIQVIDQWKHHNPRQQGDGRHNASERTIHFNNRNGEVVDQGESYYIVQ